jgi:hypothetical protein
MSEHADQPPHGAAFIETATQDLSAGQFIDWGQEFAKSGLGTPVESGQDGTPAFWRGERTDAGVVPMEKAAQVVPETAAPGTHYPQEVSAEPYEGTGAASGARPAPPAPTVQPAPLVAPMSHAANPMPFASQIAAYMAHEKAPSAAQAAPEGVPPAKMAQDPWIDWQGFTGAMSGSADNQGRGHGRPDLVVAEEDDDTEDEAEKSLARFRARMDSLLKAQTRRTRRTRLAQETTMKKSDEVDQYGRPLRKGMYAFENQGNAQALPEDMLYDYLCAAIYEAFEEQVRESAHRPMDGKDGTAALATYIGMCLVKLCPSNPNLLRACKAYGCDKGLIMRVLAEKGLGRPAADTMHTDDMAGITAMGGEALMLSEAALEVDPYGRPGLPTVSREPENAAHLLKSEDADPAAALHARRRAFHEGLWKGEEGGMQVTDPLCPIHGGRDISKAQLLNHGSLPCTC